ncbi:MAG: DUF3024 domain-containing protein [Acidimicrobiales bacterium]
MPVPDTDLARIRAYCNAKIPSHLRGEARVEADVRGNSVTIFDCRPPWHDRLTEWSRVPVTQLRYKPATKGWTLYWADRNGRWHRYEDLDADQPAQALLDEVEADPTCIFWG